VAYREYIWYFDIVKAPTNVGLDLVEIGRMRKGAVARLFTTSELVYCKKFKDQAPHLAGIFAAKEATSKALGPHKYPVQTLEVRHGKRGEPLMYHAGKKIKVAVSITHEGAYAAAVALKL
jgi:holo-[acyl-carrier protein] synthase